MAVTINDIKKLRDMTGAGLSDCKKALIESDNDIEKAKELIRKRGQAIAAKREDRDAAQGIAIGKSVGNFAAIVALKCETDFVAKNEKFVTLAKNLLDAAIENRVKTMDELTALTIDGKSVPDAITALSGITGEKMELGAYECLEAPSTVVLPRVRPRAKRLPSPAASAFAARLPRRLLRLPPRRLLPLLRLPLPRPLRLPPPSNQ